MFKNESKKVLLASKLVENVLATPGIVVLVAYTSDPGNLNSPEMSVYAFESLSSSRRRRTM